LGRLFCLSLVSLLPRSNSTGPLPAF
jgi:hypothetical protein